MTQRDTELGGVAAEELAAELLDAVGGGATLKDLHAIPQDLMDGVYAFAYRFYTQGLLDDAEVFFRFLCVYDFYNAEYAMGLAAVSQLKCEYARAINLYALAYSLSKSDYRPMFHTGQCHLLMGRPALARRCFKIVVEDSQDERLRLKAERSLKGIEEVSADRGRTAQGGS